MKLNKIWLQLGLINLLSVLTLAQETPGGSLPNPNNPGPANPNQGNKNNPANTNQGNNNNPDPANPNQGNNNNPDPANPNQGNNNNPDPANPNQGNNNNNRNKSDNKNDDDDDTDDNDNRYTNNNGINDPSKYSGLPAIIPRAPVWSQSFKSAPVSLSRALFLKWEYNLKPRDPPTSLTLTLTEKRDVLYTYVITTTISPTDTIFIWDITKYIPSGEDGHTINLVEGHKYVLYLHDSRMKFDSLYSRGMYQSARYTISFYRPIDISNPFGGAPKLTPPRSTVFLLISITILLPFLH